MAMRWMKSEFWRQVWLRLEIQSGGKPIAIYGGGQHTIRLMRFLEGVQGGPSVLAILDDNPGRETIAGIPVRKPSEVDPSETALVLVSSDSIEEKLAERAESWSNGRVPVEKLYSGMQISDQHLFDFAGDLIEILPDGSRRRVDEFGRSTITQPGAYSEKAPAALEPVKEKRISSLITPHFTVSTTPIARQVDESFKPHQIYPGDTHRPGIDMREECFVTRSEPGLVDRSTRVSVIGSCFASNFRRWLIQNGYNFCQFEDGPFTNVGSLRTGPLFNPGSVKQLLDWAYNGFTPADKVWSVRGKLCDPYRKFMSWPSEEDMHAERESHFQATRNMVEQSDVLILTLGLSEVWRNKEDKSCYYLIPPPGILDERYHEHALLTTDECVEHLETFYQILHQNNANLRLVVTLSPVPLMATYFDRHAVESDAVSKATLRTALHWFCQNHPEVIYFPSYEMAVRTPDWPYESDNRHVHPGPVVDRIMRWFMQHYGDPGDLSAQVSEPKPGAAHATA